MYRLITTAALGAVLAAGSAFAQDDWPTGDVLFVTHSSPGGGSDVLARAICRALQDTTQHACTVENHTGGSGAVALLYMANNAETDGHTLMTVTPTQIITPLRSEGIPNYEQMTPIARLFMDPALLYVREESPYQSADDMMEALADDPGQITWGIGSAGSLDQLVIQQTEEAAGVDVRIVPHEGGGDAKTAVLGGHVDAALGEPAELVSQIDSGDVRVLATYTEERLGILPDVPTMMELGYDVASTKFRGVFGPPGLSDAMVARVAGRLEQLYDAETFKEYYVPGALQPAFISGDEFVEFLGGSNERIAAFLAEQQ